MMTIHEQLSTTSNQFVQSGISSARLDAEVLLAYVLGVERSWLVAHGDEELESKEVRKLGSVVGRRMKREPIAYLTGTKEFYGREFSVTPDVLIPRPETESLVELFFELESKEVRKLGSKEEASESDTTSAIHLQPETALLRAQGSPGAKPWSRSTYAGSEKKHRVLDVGCGSGCIGITLKLEQPELYVTLSDISPASLTIAENNARQLHAEVGFAESNLLENYIAAKIQNPKSKIYFDTIVANLPYVDKTWKRSPETDHEPALALFANESGLGLIKQLIEQSTHVLAPNGVLLLEADPCQHHDIVAYGEQYGFIHANTLDYAIALQKSA